jgi:hypothetical protein
MGARSITESVGCSVMGLLAAGVLSLGALGLGSIPGCATYANYPPIGQDLAVNDPNVIPIPVLMRVALTRTLQNDSQTGELPERWVLNLPRGTTLERARSVLDNTMRDAGVSGGMLVGDAGYQGLPAYSITRVWLRGDSATVDVIRPVTLDGMPPTEADTGGVGYTYQKVTHRLKGGFRPWRVETSRAWPIGLEDQPELFGWPTGTDGSAPMTTPDQDS